MRWFKSRQPWLTITTLYVSSDGTKNVIRPSDSFLFPSTWNVSFCFLVRSGLEKVGEIHGIPK
jgi:hypothetical protein